jgi:hypothetical protein
MHSLQNESGLQSVKPVKFGRRRRDWVRGEVRCLSCSRLMGRLLGARADLGFFAYKPVESDARVVAYTSGTRLRCGVCGGAGTLDEVEFLSTYEVRPDAFTEEEPQLRRPGRAPRPLKPYVPPAQITIQVA